MAISKRTQYGLPDKYVSGKMALYRNGFLFDWKFFYDRRDRQKKLATFFLMIDEQKELNNFLIVINIDDDYTLSLD